MKQGPRLAVIGGGLAGAALVLALRREGQNHVTWYTAQDAAPGAVGTGFLELPPNAARVLNALGLRSQLDGFSKQPQALLHRAAGNSFVWADLPLGSFVIDRFKAPFLCGNPAALRRHLHNECVSLPGEQRSPRAAAATADGAVQAADGSWQSYDLVVLATGADAILNTELQHDTSSSTPSVMFNAALALEALPAALAQPVLTRWSHPEFDLWTLPETAGERLLLKLAPTEDGQGARTAGDRAPVAALPGWTAGAQWQPVQQQQTAAPEQLYRDRLVLCGNAAHRLPLGSGLGPALGLEDAWVLSRLIEQNDDELGAVGPEFQRYRAPRSRQVRQRTDRDRGRWYAPSAPRRTLYRLRSLLTHRFLPEFAYQELDWLYGYDCVRGFR
ncbi:MAG: hypothetical protein AAGG11_05165 [Pseudomonadota bacterium]